MLPYPHEKGKAVRERPSGNVYSWVIQGIVLWPAFLSDLLNRATLYHLKGPVKGNHDRCQPFIPFFLFEPPFLQPKSVAAAEESRRNTLRPGGVIVVHELWAI